MIRKAGGCCRRARSQLRYRRSFVLTRNIRVAADASLPLSRAQASPIDLGLLRCVACIVSAESKWDACGAIHGKIYKGFFDVLES
jgi:hypothetical protein